MAPFTCLGYSARLLAPSWNYLAHPLAHLKRIAAPRMNSAFPLPFLRIPLETKPEDERDSATDVLGLFCSCLGSIL